MEVIGCVVGDVGRESGHEIPGQLRRLGKGGGNPNAVTREESTYVDLIVGSNLQLEVTVAGGEVPFIAEVVIKSNHKEVTGLRQGEICLVTTNVAHAPRHIAATQPAIPIHLVGKRHVLVPHLLHERVYTLSARIANVIRESIRGRAICVCVEIEGYS